MAAILGFTTDAMGSELPDWVQNCQAGFRTARLVFRTARQGSVLPDLCSELSGRVQNCLASVLGCYDAHDWARYELLDWSHDGVHEKQRSCHCCPFAHLLPLNQR